MPISDELHDLVGNPVPSGDLGHRARQRAGEIKRRRLAGITTSVVAVGVLAVPGALLVRDHSGNVNGAAGGGGAPTPAATTAVPDVKTALVPAHTEVRPGTPTAKDKARAAKALSLLGKGFTQTGSGVVVDAETGKVVGGSATFTATDGGGTVAVQWTEGVGAVYALSAPGLAGAPAVPSAAVASAVTAMASAVGPAPSGAPASAVTAIVVGASGGPSLTRASAVAGKPSSVTSESGGNTVTEPGAVTAGTVWTNSGSGSISGMVSVNGNLGLSIKVVQGSAGSPRILSGKAALTFANALAKAMR